ncbi:sensor histidine kinase [Sutterella sp.]|uniref:sensor histidine kinase n=1 Tax=Sutterella sp. TaxID=1981025 RepID=UPI0026E0CD30|nr:sensor histidine kinase [Sutterella sp.]MDO5531173.1 PhnD/SsuA/transferrin family substrate-binding protein [Sutterella sp.]
MRLQLIRTILLTLLAACAAGSPAADDVVRFGLLDIEREATYGDRRDNVQASTVDYLRGACPTLQFEVKTYDIIGLREAIHAGEVDAFLSSSGFFVEFWQHGAKDLATLVSTDFPDPNQCVGGSFIVSADKPGRLTIDDLQGLRATAPNPQNFMAFQIGMAEIARRGYDPRKFFSSVSYTGNDLREVLRRVASGEADVGLVRACILESLEQRMPELQGKLRVVEPAAAGSLRCAVSTRLYPGWTVAVTAGIRPQTAELIARALLNQPATAEGGYHWSVATDFKSVNEVFRLLKTGPYAYLSEWTLKGFLVRYWPWFAVLALGLLFWILHWLRAESLVKKRTAELNAALEREEALHRQAIGAAEESERLLQLGVVNELSCIYAHEMAQPLTSIGYLARTLRTLCGREPVNRELIGRCAKKITADLAAAQAILARVRRYAKAPIRRSDPVDLTALTCEVAESVRRLNPGTPLTVEAAENVTVRGDALELSILVLNLLKNAASAASALKGDVSVTLGTVESDGKPFARLVIRNIGTKLSVTPFAERMLIRSDPDAAASADAKPRSGLGLGLLIVQSIVRAHGGTFETSSVPIAEGETPERITITVTLPLAKPDESVEAEEH